MKKGTKNLCVMILILSLLALLFTGCGTETKDNTDTAEGAAGALLDAIKAGDYERMASLASEDAVNNDLAFASQLETFSDGLIATLGTSEEKISKEAQKALDGLQELLIKEYVESYEILDVKEDGDRCDVACKVKFGFDTRNIVGSEFSQKLSSIMQNYVNENMEELVKIKNEEGQEAVTEKLINGLLPEICDNIKTSISESEGDSEDIDIIVEKQDGHWVVTGAVVAE